MMEASCLRLIKTDDDKYVIPRLSYIQLMVQGTDGFRPAGARAQLYRNQEKGSVIPLKGG